MTTATKLETLREELRGQSVGDTRILDVRPELSETLDGEELTRVWLLLSAPEAETWDLDVLRRLRTFVEDKAQTLELPNTFVRFGAQGDEDIEDLDG